MTCGQRRACADVRLCRRAFVRLPPGGVMYGCGSEHRQGCTEVGERTSAGLRRFWPRVVPAHRFFAGVGRYELQGPRADVDIKIPTETQPLARHPVPGRIKQELDGAVVDAALVVAIGPGLD